MYSFFQAFQVHTIRTWICTLTLFIDTEAACSVLSRRYLRSHSLSCLRKGLASGERKRTGTLLRESGWGLASKGLTNINNWCLACDLELTSTNRRHLLIRPRVTVTWGKRLSVGLLRQLLHRPRDSAAAGLLHSDPQIQPRCNPFLCCLSCPQAQEFLNWSSHHSTFSPRW